MLKRIRKRLSYGNVVASLALFIALGGVSYAATAERNSVVSSSIKNGQVKSVDVGNNAITSSKIKNGNVGNRDLAPKAVSATKLATALKADLDDAATLGGAAPTAFVKKADVATRHFSCAGTAWESVFDATVKAVSGSMKYATAGNALFRCSVAIPDGATVTAVNFAVRDTSATFSADCDLWRTNTVTAIGTETQLATVATGAAAAPGNVRISDTTITQPTIDNDTFAYFVQCDLGTDINTGVFSANLTYTTTAGEPAPAATPAVAPSGESSTD